MIILLFFSLFFSKDLSLPGFPKYNNIVQSIRDDYGRDLNRKFGYVIAATGGGIPDGVYCTCWTINSKEPANLEQSRIRFIAIIEGLLKRINNNKRMKMHIVDKPLTFHNIDLMLGIIKPVPNFSNSVELVFKSGNIIYYATEDKSQATGLRNFHNETYEEALEIAKKNSQFYEIAK